MLMLDSHGQLLATPSGVEGQTVCDRDGKSLGKVATVVMDLASGRIAYLVVTGGGLFGGSGKHHPIPFARFRPDPKTGGFVTDLSRDQVAATPAYDKDQLASSSYGWSEQVERFFAERRGAA